MTVLRQQRVSAPTTPLPRPVHRRRLLDALGRATEGGATVLAAPAGFGKSVLLEQWTAEADGRPIGRVTLHRRDDAQQIAGGLVSALEHVGAAVSPGTLSLLHGHGHGHGRGLGDAFISSLIADL